MWGGGCYEHIPSDGAVQVIDLPVDIPPGGPAHEFSPLGDAEAADIVERFDWADTEPLPETGPTGLPKVYYAIVRIDSRRHYQLLRQARIPSDLRPLFHEDASPLHEEAVQQLSASTSSGAWMYVLLGGAVYNVLRRSALEGAPVFEVVSLLDPPAGISRDPDGALALEALLQRGMPWSEPLPSHDDSAEGADDGEVGVRQEALSEVISGTARLFIEVARGVADVIRDFIALLFGALSDRTAVTAGLTITTIDRDYVPAFAPMLRTWGPTRGLPIDNAGQEVLLRRLSFPFGIWSERLMPGNAAAFDVPDNSIYQFCTVNEIGEGAVVDMFVTTQTCSQPFAIADGATAATIAPVLASHDLQAITIANDAMQFAGSNQFFVGLRVRSSPAATTGSSSHRRATGTSWASGASHRPSSRRSQRSTWPCSRQLGPGFPSSRPFPRTRRHCSSCEA